MFGPQGEEISFGGWLAVMGPLCFFNLIVLWIVLVIYFILPYRSFCTFNPFRFLQSIRRNDDIRNVNDVKDSSRNSNSSRKSSMNGNNSRKDRSRNGYRRADLRPFDSNHSDCDENENKNENENGTVINSEVGKVMEKRENRIENKRNVVGVENKLQDENKQQVQEEKEEEEGEEEEEKEEKGRHKVEERDVDLSQPLNYPEWIVVSQ